MPENMIAGERWHCLTGLVVGLSEGEPNILGLFSSSEFSFLPLKSLFITITVLNFICSDYEPKVVAF